MTRPTISDFFPESFTPMDLNKIFIDHPEIYRYINALNEYIDWLVDIPKTDAINHRARQVELFQKAIEAKEDEFGLHVINTPYGDLTFKKLDSLAPNKIFIQNSDKNVNFQIVKEYSQEEINEKYHQGICPECEGKLRYNGTTNQGWTYKSTCDSCHTNFLFDQSDMGQTLPYLRKDSNP
jgi:hypothetical protein